MNPTHDDPDPQENRPRCGARGRGTAGPALGALLWALAAGCGSPDPGVEAGDAGAEERARRTGFRGVALPEPMPAADFTLADTRGRPFRFGPETQGRLTLLFFGYTHCPDVCPVHMANLAAVLEDLPYAQRRRVRVVFVTTDPERDTPARLRAWLDRFDPGFVGLRGSPEEVDEVQRRLGLPPAARPAAASGDYRVGHASQVLAIGPDGFVRVAYPFGTRQADWAHDLPKLAAEALPDAR